ncbi:hypothetical protein GOP47_0001759 [Adiantum capillus-veneris]|uniref:TatD related DNase n=2 Tax=Adiantum capillus-veneris TaxID=13818 RepID=A0A9D4ZQC1_ADICA|nr:hypothetical protein GOP47_0001759 [Adiantum capillus-veneris]
MRINFIVDFIIVLHHDSHSEEAKNFNSSTWSFLQQARMHARAGLPIFDAHCHLQDPRIVNALPSLLEAATRTGVKWFAVNGTSEDDWEEVKKLSEQHNEIIPCFGLHPWYVERRSNQWFERLRSMLEGVPTAAVGEAGLDKGARGKEISIAVQVDVLKQQLMLAKELQRPISLHCVRAFGELQETLKELGPFPHGAILHSFLGSAEMVQPLAKQGAFFSFSGFLTALSAKKAKKMLQEVPLDRILIETDAPDAVPKVEPSSLMWVPGDANAPAQLSDAGKVEDISSQALNHPANIKTVLTYVASMKGIEEDTVASAAYRNAKQLFTYPGSKIRA